MVGHMGRVWMPCVLGLLLLPAGCREAQEPPRPRVVSLSAAGSRALLALGAGEAVVAVDRGSGALEAFAELPQVEWGDLESQRPSLVVAPPAPAELEWRRESLRARGIHANLRRIIDEKRPGDRANQENETNACAEHGDRHPQSFGVDLVLVVGEPVPSPKNRRQS